MRLDKLNGISMARMVASGSIALLFSVGALGAPSPSKPNVLFIMVDDLNTDVGFMGDSGALTPCMDRLASQSTVFDHAYCQAPICGPSRNSLLTGRYPHKTGLYGLDPLFRDVDEWKDLVSLPQYFRENGYHSATVGKIYHSKPDKKSFDENLGWFGAFGPFPEKTIHLDPGLPVHPYYDWGPYLDDPETADFKVAQAACGLIEKASSSEEPFFISVGFFRPHCPLYAPQRWFDLHPIESIASVTDQSEDLADISPYALKLVNYKGRQKYNRWLQDGGHSASFLQAYRACVSFTDHCVGMVLDTLRESGLDKNTVVVLMGDHGVQNGRKNLWYKRTLWEASTHVALVLQTPGQKKPRTVGVPVGLIDVYPTLCALSGLPAPSGLDGISLDGLIANQPGAKKRPPVLTSHGPGNFALRDARWRYIRYADGSEELYDHTTDPDEHENLASNPKYAPVIARFSPFIPKKSHPFAPGCKGMASAAFPGK